MNDPDAASFPKRSYLVYFAGPFTGNEFDNVRHAVHQAENTWLEHGNKVIPIVPHLSAMYHLICPHSYQWWMNHCIQVMKRCDVVFKWGDSPGADREQREASLAGIPVVLNAGELREWLKTKGRVTT